MTAILGISAFYHDSAAALLLDGRIAAAAQEERFTRKKHDQGFPTRAVEYCLAEAGLTVEEIDYVAFYDKPLLKFDRLLETYLAFAPAGFRSFLQAIPLWLRQKLHVPREIRRGLGGKHRRRPIFAEHHESHAASAFFPSPFDEAAILTLDGVGEWATASLGYGRGNRITLTDELRFPHSLGLLYSAFTYYCGFRVNSGEYKLMGLAPYGQPRYEREILTKLMDLKEDGSLRLDLSYFNYCQGLTMTSARFHRLFGGPPRKPESPITQREMDIAASIQRVTEEVVLRAARHLHQKTGMRRLCLAGGVALNCVANGRLLREGPFEDLWIQPAAGDAGGALGVALLVWHQLLDNPRTPLPCDAQQGSLLGPRFGRDAILATLKRHGARFHEHADEDDLCRRVAGLLADQRVVGWFHGRMEFGPRALGSRSILGDARSPTMQSLMNRKIKFRESFRPFAPIVPRDRACEYFELDAGRESPYMLLVAAVRGLSQDAQGKRSSALPGDCPDFCAPTRSGGTKMGLSPLRDTRNCTLPLPAVTHVDGSARVQTVDAQRHGRLHRLLAAFETRTGCPVLINTSFNVRGEPIVCTPDDAWRCFMATNIDVLVLEDFVLLKEEQPGAKQHEVEAYLAQFPLD